MAFGNFIRLIRIFKHLINRKEVSPLPNDLIVEILSRLPAHLVLRCRKVSKRWEALTLAPHFTLLHAINAPSITFLHYLAGREQQFYFLDTKAKKKKMIEKVHFSSTKPLIREYLLLGCCHGLLLFAPLSGGSNFFYVCNPFKPGRFLLKGPDRVGYLCGIYFYPLIRDYRILYATEINNDREYLVFSLRTLRWRRLCSFVYWPQVGVAPICIAGLMHWMVKDKPLIMTFTFETEEFNVSPCPGCMCHSRPTPGMQLLQIGSQLALCMFCCGKIGVWVLQDYANWVWVNKYRICLELDLKRYSFTPGNEINDIKVVIVENAELVLFWAYKGLFRYHLQSKTLKKFLNTKSVKCLHATSYTKSFVTLRRLVNYTSDNDIKKFGKLGL